MGSILATRWDDRTEEAISPAWTSPVGYAPDPATASVPVAPPADVEAKSWTAEADLSILDSWRVEVWNPRRGPLETFVYPSSEGFVCLRRRTLWGGSELRVFSDPDKVLVVRDGVRAPPPEPVLWKISGARSRNPPLRAWDPTAPIEILHPGGGARQELSLDGNSVKRGKLFDRAEIEGVYSQVVLCQGAFLVGWGYEREAWLWKGPAARDVRPDLTLKRHYEETYAGTWEAALEDRALDSSDLDCTTALERFASAFALPTGREEADWEMPGFVKRAVRELNRCCEELRREGKSSLLIDRLTPDLIAEVDDARLTAEWRSALRAAGGTEELLSGLEELANRIGYDHLDAEIESLYVDHARKLLREEDFHSARFWIVRGLGYYPQNGELRTLASDLQTDVRVIETENFILSSSADGIVTQSVAGALEGFRSFILSELSPFFEPGQGRRSMQKARVNLFRNAGHYEKSQEGHEGRKWRWGHYSPFSDVVSIYEERPERSRRIIESMQHELTHQLLYRAYRRNLAPVWVTEGLAQAMEFAVGSGESGYGLPAGKEHHAVKSAASRLKKEAPRTLGELMALTVDQFYEDDRHDNYTMAGAFCRFFLESERFREPFLLYARDAYRGKLQGDLSAYLGTDIPSLEASFEEYLR